VYLATKDTLLAWLVLPSGLVYVARQAVSRDSVSRLVAAARGAIGAADVGARGLPTMESDGMPVDRSTPETSRGGTSRGPTSAATAAAQRLAEVRNVLLPASLMRRLPSHGGLLVIPQGPLALVPFAALGIGRAGGVRAGDRLGTHYALRYAPSLATLRAVTADAKPRRAPALVVGDPTMPSARSAGGRLVRLPPLPGARREAQWVARALGTTMTTGDGATEGVVRDRMSSAGVVHLATHGFAYSSDARVLDSFVALAPDSAHDAATDGLLTMGEVLDAPTRLVADLVVLSACQTGLGNLKQAEGTVGLQRAFLAKGAKSVLVSLWSVSDEATALLMRRFYTHWLHDIDAPDKAEALRRAQGDVRSVPRFRAPRYWAAFQLVGAP
jgi:CHAT domain-containing protein